MVPLVAGALIGGGASLLGGFMGSSAAKAEAERNREFQKYMASHAHQLEARDLRRAGLNRILTATGGSGASVPSGAMAQLPDLARVGKDVGDRLAQITELKLANSQAEKNDSETRNNNYNYEMNRKYGDMERQAGVWSAREQAKNTEAQGRNLAATLGSIQSDIQAKALSNAEAARLLNRKLSNPAFQDYLDSVPYAERNNLDQLIKGGASPGDIIAFILRLLQR